MRCLVQWLPWDISFTFSLGIFMSVCSFPNIEKKDFKRLKWKDIEGSNTAAEQSHILIAFYWNCYCDSNYNVILS